MHTQKFEEATSLIFASFSVTLLEIEKTPCFCSQGKRMNRSTSFTFLAAPRRAPYTLLVDTMDRRCVAFNGGSRVKVVKVGKLD